MKKMNYRGETFYLDDSKGCFIEVKYKSFTGYVGVNLTDSANATSPYAWSIDGRIGTVPNDEGLTSGVPVRGATNVGAAVQKLCEELMRVWQVDEARKVFQPETACEALHEYFKGLPDN